MEVLVTICWFNIKAVGITPYLKLTFKSKKLTLFFEVSYGKLKL